jgi:hypothetical protein
MAVEKIPYTINTHQLNSYGFAVLTSGIDLTRYMTNSIVLKNHNFDNPIGTAENVKLKEKEAQATVVIDDTDDADLTKLNRDIKKNLYNGISMGLNPKNGMRSFQLGVEGFPPDVPVLVESELLELSVTPVPSNGGCIRLYMEGKHVPEEEFKVQLNAISKPTNISLMNKILIFLMSMAQFKLTAASNEDHAIEAIKLMVADNERLAKEKEVLQKEIDKMKGEKKTAMELEAKSVVELAVKANKIKETDRAHYEKLALADLPATTAILNSMTPYQALSAPASLNAAEPGANKYADWSFDKLWKEAPQELDRIRKEEPELYKKLKAGINTKV